MKIAGSYLFDVPKEAIWRTVLDPDSLLHLIPGGERIEQLGPDEYRGQVVVRLAGVAGMYTTRIRLVERDEPHSCRMEGEAEGAAGSIRGTASLRLSEQARQTRLEYEGQGVVGGLLGALGSRIIEGVVQSMIQQGLARLNEQLQREALAGGEPRAGSV
jgi:carbon monoxide dehydrogenase subunit G